MHYIDNGIHKKRGPLDSIARKRPYLFDDSVICRSGEKEWTMYNYKNELITSLTNDSVTRMNKYPEGKFVVIYNKVCVIDKPNRMCVESYRVDGSNRSTSDSRPIFDTKEEAQQWIDDMHKRARMEFVRSAIDRQMGELAGKRSTAYKKVVSYYMLKNISKIAKDIDSISFDEFGIKGVELGEIKPYSKIKLNRSDDVVLDTNLPEKNEAVNKKIIDLSPFSSEANRYEGIELFLQTYYPDISVGDINGVVSLIGKDDSVFELSIEEMRAAVGYRISPYINGGWYKNKDFRSKTIRRYTVVEKHGILIPYLDGVLCAKVLYPIEQKDIDELLSLYDNSNGMSLQEAEKILAVKHNEQIYIDEIEKSVDMILDLPQINDVTYQDGEIRFITNDIVIDEFHDYRAESCYNMGQYIIVINLSTKDVAIKRYGQRGTTDGGYFHPHVSSTGNMCMGGFEGAIRDALDKGDLVPLMMNVLDHLRIYGDSSPYSGFRNFIDDRVAIECDGDYEVIYTNEDQEDDGDQEDGGF